MYWAYGSRGLRICHGGEGLAEDSWSRELSAHVFKHMWKVEKLELGQGYEFDRPAP